MEIDEQKLCHIARIDSCGCRTSTACNPHDQSLLSSLVVMARFA
jgi:hypothetical protein